MFKLSTIKKVVRKMKGTEAKYAMVNVHDIPMCISDGNKKIGRVMNVSIPPILSCGNCGECQYLCYDLKACNQYPNTVIDARIRNWVVLNKDRDLYFDTIRKKLKRRRKNLYFRWHVAGDIVDADYLDRMVKIAIEFPKVTFWTYTKMYAIVNGYRKNHEIPSNLSIMFSEWRGMPMDNPYGFPEFRVVFKDEVEPKGFYCPGNCDICKKTKHGCIARETTYCKEH